MNALKTIFFAISILQIATSFSQTNKLPIDYFNEAAQHYISDDKLNAIKTLNKGLKEHENNEEMERLAEEFFKKLDEQQKQQQQQQQQQQQEQKNKEQKNKEQENKEEQNKKEQSKEEQNKKEQSKEQENKEEQNKEQEKKKTDALLKVISNDEDDVLQKVFGKKIRNQKKSSKTKDW